MSMIFGIGVDMIETSRVKEKVEKENGFREFVFTPDEISYCESKTDSAQHFAARFAAKEALLKALGTGWPGGLALNEISVITHESGKPVFEFSGNTALIISERRLGTVHLSLSHLKDLACATVVIEAE